MALSSSPDSSPVSVRQDKGAGCIIAFFSIFLFVGLAVFVGIFVLPLSRVIQSQSWAHVPCVITAAQVNTRRSSKSTNYSFDVAYTYNYKGQSHIGDRLNFNASETGSYNSRIAYSNLYPVNSTATCYVNPSDPTQAVLERSMGSDAWLSLMPLIFVAVGGGGIVFAWKGMRQQNFPKENWAPKSVSSRAPAAGVAPLSNASVTPSPFDAGPFQSLERNTTPTYAAPTSVQSESNGAVTLKPGSTPIGRIVGGFLIAAFWNGIVSIFLFQMLGEVFSGKAGVFNIFLGLFLVPFVLVGLGLLAYFFSTVLAFFNSRAVVTLSRDGLRPGESAELSWQMHGGLTKPTSLVWTLEGREEATYRRGTDTVTDKSVFHREVLLEAPIANAASGNARITIPADTMHSLESRNNKIIWTLKLHGPVNLWPDVQEEYKIVIEPARPTS